MPITLEFAHTVGGILRKVPKGAKITDTICEPNPTRGISQLVHCAVCYAAKGGTGSWWRSNSSTQRGIVAFWTWFESVTNVARDLRSTQLQAEWQFPQPYCTR